MSLQKRLLYFAIGLCIGIVFVRIIFNKKEVTFDYLPNDRVLKTLRTKQRVFENTALEFFKKESIDTAQLEFFLTNAKVDFSKSKQREKPCNFYHIDTEFKQSIISLYVKNCDSVVSIQKAKKIMKD